MKTPDPELPGLMVLMQSKRRDGRTGHPKLLLVIRHEQGHQPLVLEHPASCRSSPLCFFTLPLHDYQKILSSFLFFTTNPISTSPFYSKPYHQFDSLSAAVMFTALLVLFIHVSGSIICSSL